MKNVIEAIKGLVMYVLSCLAIIIIVGIPLIVGGKFLIWLWSVI